MQILEQNLVFEIVTRGKSVVFHIFKPGELLLRRLFVEYRKNDPDLFPNPTNKKIANQLQRQIQTIERTLAAKWKELEWPNLMPLLSNAVDRYMLDIYRPTGGLDQVMDSWWIKFLSPLPKEAAARLPKMLKEVGDKVHIPKSWDNLLEKTRKTVEATVRD